MMSTEQHVNVAFSDRQTMRMVRDLPHPVERVWAALTEVDELDRWFIGPAVLDPRPGGAYRFGLHFAGTIQAIEPPHLLELDWWRYELSPTASGCRLVFTAWVDPGFVASTRPDPTAGTDQPLGPGTWCPGTLAGWHGFLDNLEQALDDPYGEYGWPRVEDDDNATDGSAVIAAYRQVLLTADIPSESASRRRGPSRPEGQVPILQALVGRASDDEIDRLVVDFGGYHDMCVLVLRGLQDDAAPMGIAPPGADVRVGFDAGGGLAWTMTIADGSSRLEPGVASSARAVVRATTPDFLRLMAERSRAGLPGVVVEGREQELEDLFALNWLA